MAEQHGEEAPDLLGCRRCGWLLPPSRGDAEAGLPERGAWHARVPVGCERRGETEHPEVPGGPVLRRARVCVGGCGANGFPSRINTACAFRGGNGFGFTEQSFEYSLSKQPVQKIILIALLLAGLQNGSQIEEASLSAIEAFWARHIPCIREDLYCFDQTSLSVVYLYASKYILCSLQTFLASSKITFQYRAIKMCLLTLFNEFCAERGVRVCTCVF